MSYNMRNPAVKRLMREAVELKDPTELFWAQPLEDNLFEWHFTVRGPPDTEFEAGVYHGRIILPTEYPMKPPSIMLLTPNGRFEINKKICLSISGYHPESWQPSWSIRTALLAIVGFMPTHGAGAIGSLDYSADERKVLAQKSQDWKCPTCKCLLRDILPPLTEASKETTAEARQIATQIAFKDEKEEQAEKSSVQDDRQSQNSADVANTDGEQSVDESTAGTAVYGEVRQRPAAVDSQRNTRPPSQVGQTAPTTGPNVVRADSGAYAYGRAAVSEQNGNSGSFIMIIILSLMIAALLFRRLYIINEWRF